MTCKYDIGNIMNNYKFKLEKNIFLSELCKIRNLYDILSIDENLLHKYSKFKYDCKEGIFIFIKNIMKKKIQEKETLENNPVFKELEMFIDYFVHYEEYLFDTENKNNYNYDSNSNSDSDNDNYSENSFLQVNVKNLYLHDNNVGSILIKYISFDYNEKTNVDNEDLSKIENIFFNLNNSHNDKLIINSLGKPTNYTKELYLKFNFKHISFDDFTKFLICIFNADYELTQKDFYKDIDKESKSKSKSESENEKEYEYEIIEIDAACECEYELNYQFKKSLCEELYKIKNKHQLSDEIFVEILDDYIKNIFFNERKEIIDKIVNIDYSYNISQSYMDDICEIINFDIIVNEDLYTINYVKFDGIAKRTKDYHLDSIKNIYINDILVFSHDEIKENIMQFQENDFFKDLILFISK
jgi:hypothetical protein